MKKIFYIGLLAVLLFGCGVKKGVVTDAQGPSVAEQPQTTDMTTTDTLPDFLKEFANDSTIHINWAYGIPFIIDDSVPMFLPPIDKNPEGYVSSKNYETIQRGTNQGEKISVCGIKNPVDSILWLNKCINDIQDFKDSSLFPVSHYYRYDLYSYTIDENTNILVFGVFISPYWACIADATPRMQLGIFYIFDCEGFLLGKMNVYEPVEWKSIDTKQIGESDNFLPEAQGILSLLNNKGIRERLLPLYFLKEDPNRPSPCPYEI